MGTALTDRQLKELSRLTHKAWLCFDGDAAGEAATCAGWTRGGAGVRRPRRDLPPGRDPADPPASSTALGRAELPPTACGDRAAPDRQEAFFR
jgi:DNA primase